MSRKSRQLLEIPSHLLESTGGMYTLIKLWMVGVADMVGICENPGAVEGVVVKMTVGPVEEKVEGKVVVPMPLVVVVELGVREMGVAKGLWV